MSAARLSRISFGSLSGSPEYHGKTINNWIQFKFIDNLIELKSDLQNKKGTNLDVLVQTFVIAGNCSRVLVRLRTHRRSDQAVLCRIVCSYTIEWRQQHQECVWVAFELGLHAMLSIHSKRASCRTQLVSHRRNCRRLWLLVHRQWSILHLVILLWYTVSQQASVDKDLYRFRNKIKQMPNQ